MDSVWGREVLGVEVMRVLNGFSNKEERASLEYNSLVVGMDGILRFSVYILPVSVYLENVERISMMRNEIEVLRDVKGDIIDYHVKLIDVVVNGSEVEVREVVFLDEGFMRLFILRNGERFVDYLEGIKN